MEAFEISTVTRDGQCEKHGAFTETGLALPLTKRTIWPGCPTCDTEKRAAQEERQREKAERERQVRAEERLSYARIPRRFCDSTFDNFVADTDQKREAVRIVREFAETFEEHYRTGTNIILSGKPGTGKTHLATAAALLVVQQRAALYLNAMDLVRMVRDTWRRDSKLTESEVLDDLGSIGLLTIDEIGTQYGTEGERTILFDVIDRRYRNLRPTILATNLDVKGMKEFLGDRSFDRLREGGIWVAFDWESYRGRRPE
ncbi:ATP-binding protein [Burkholderia pseudomallei]|uniref:ATP-binding protein n=1 Tax=Burkholderia pseudomallei TaxID=28450 RepID=UPI0003A52028|nr:ATP-binding protein [Burkholderia pseudomallei]KIX61043.1 DNA replication protein DnaC [Burkholderia pseudomallei]MBF3451136.1 ATP-binding protein [Burkholderia pseudomallei]MBF3475505.1 ATP-binding protein [Burkholderia pseudomallei]MBF3511198.1 ATP-binding protein [Burkholderia pseudomallei]MBF3513825.1 ATP-binding protein [Burkholderia pseudomallei]